MLIVRPVKKSDLKDLHALANAAGVGITTLPKDKKAMEQKISHSIESFAKKPDPKKKFYYLLVMEDTDKKKVIGTAGIAVGVGLDKPFYTYRRLHITHENREMDKRVDTELLQILSVPLRYQPSILIKPIGAQVQGVYYRSLGIS